MTKFGLRTQGPFVILVLQINLPFVHGQNLVETLEKRGFTNSKERERRELSKSSSYTHKVNGFRCTLHSSNEAVALLPYSRRPSDRQDTFLQLDIDVAEEPRAVFLFLAYAHSTEQRGRRHC